MANITIRLEAKEQVDETVADVAVSPSSNQSGISIANDDIIETASVGMVAGSKMNASSLLMKAGVSAGVIAIAMKAYQLAEKAWQINRENQKNQRNQSEQLRVLGGAGFSENAIGERFNVVTQRYTGGTNITYKRR